MISLKQKLISKSDELAHDVYVVLREFPLEEKFGVVNQLRRAIVSVPVNIIEGFARGGDAELKRFMNIAFGSLSEVKYLLYFSYKEKFLRKETYLLLRDKCEELSKLMWKFIQKLKDDLKS